MVGSKGFRFEHAAYALGTSDDVATHSDMFDSWVVQYYDTHMSVFMVAFGSRQNIR